MKLTVKLWDENRKCFVGHENENVYWNNTNGVITAHIADGCYWRELQILIGTGKNDKHDKEIFEGDIVRAFPHDTPYKVVFQSGCFCLDLSEHGHYYSLAGCLIDYLEIIGNALENPDIIN